MTDAPTLEALLARVEAATGADRELDALICVAFADVPEPPGVFKLGACPPLTRLHDDWRIDCVYVSGVVRSHTPKAYTATIDAAIALCERVLPGCWWDIEREFVYDKGEIRERYVGRLRRARDAYLQVTTASHPALALLAALLRAKIAEQTHE